MERFLKDSVEGLCKWHDVHSDDDYDEWIRDITICSNLFKFTVVDLSQVS
jgi:hypothetical protein